MFLESPKIAESIQEQYEVIIWRSLVTVPRLPDLIADILWSEFNIVEKEEARLLPQLIACVQSRSCLIMLDGIKTILLPQTFSGKYREQYEDYANLLQAIEEGNYSSCILITCLEDLSGSTSARNYDSSYCLRLSGLSNLESQLLLEKENLSSVVELEKLSEYCEGNPGILLSATHIINNLFYGNIQEFLEQKSLVFGAIEKTLNKSFLRLSTLETEILFWLVSELQPLSLVQIQQSIPLSIYGVELIQALESLTQRSLIKVQQTEQHSVYALVPMIRELVTNHFIAQISEEFSLVNRLNSCPEELTIGLGKMTPKPTHLSNWLENSFGGEWQPMAKLFANSQKVSVRLRSLFYLRSQEIIKRFKQIKLQGNKPISILLMIAVISEEQLVKIFVQAQPAFFEQSLPVNLKLNLLDSTGTNLTNVYAKSNDSYIQLPCFRGEREEKFKVNLTLESANYEEAFLI